MAADFTNAAAGPPEPAAPSPEVQALLERNAFLEEQIAELRRSSMVEKARLAQRNTGRPEPAAPSPEVQALLERIAFLEEQIAELRRAAMVEKARLAPRRASRKATLRRICDALAPAPAGRLAGRVAQEQAYKLIKMRPLMRPLEDLLRRLRTKW